MSKAVATVAAPDPFSCITTDDGNTKRCECRRFWWCQWLSTEWPINDSSNGSSKPRSGYAEICQQAAGGGIQFPTDTGLPNAFRGTSTGQNAGADCAAGPQNEPRKRPFLPYETPLIAKRSKLATSMTVVTNNPLSLWALLPIRYGPRLQLPQGHRAPM